MIVREIMSKDVYVVTPRDNLAYIRNLFLKKGISRVLVYDKKPVGVLTERDMAKVFTERREPIDEIRADEVMTKNVITATVDDAPEKVAGIMIEKNISGVPIVAGDTIVGIVTKTDLTRYFADNFKGQIKVSDLMEPNVFTIEEFHSIFHAAKVMRERRVSRLVVLREAEVAGIIADRDLSLACFGLKPTRVDFMRKTRRGVEARNVIFYPLIVSDLMQSPVETITSSDDAAKAAAQMLKKDIGSLVAMDEKKLVGIVTKTDYVAWLAEQAREAL